MSIDTKEKAIDKMHVFPNKCMCLVKSSKDEGKLIHDL